MEKIEVVKKIMQDYENNKNDIEKRYREKPRELVIIEAEIRRAENNITELKEELENINTRNIEEYDVETIKKINFYKDCIFDAEKSKKEAEEAKDKFLKEQNKQELEARKKVELLDNETKTRGALTRQKISLEKEFEEVKKKIEEELKLKKEMYEVIEVTGEDGKSVEQRIVKDPEKLEEIENTYKELKKEKEDIMKSIKYCEDSLAVFIEKDNEMAKRIEDILNKRDGVNKKESEEKAKNDKQENKESEKTEDSEELPKIDISDVVDEIQTEKMEEMRENSKREKKPEPVQETKQSNTPVKEVNKTEKQEAKKENKEDKEKNVNKENKDTNKIEDLSIKIIYNAKDDAYCIEDLTNGKISEYPRKDLYVVDSKRLAEKSGINPEKLENIDMNVLQVLFKFDKENNSTKRFQYYNVITKQTKSKREIKEETKRGKLEFEVEDDIADNVIENMKKNKIEIIYDMRGLYKKDKDNINNFSQYERYDLLKIANDAKKFGIAKVKKGFRVAMMEKIDRIINSFSNIKRLNPPAKENRFEGTTNPDRLEKMEKAYNRELLKHDIENRIKQLKVNKDVKDNLDKVSQKHAEAQEKQDENIQKNDEIEK